MSEAAPRTKRLMMTLIKWWLAGLLWSGCTGPGPKPIHRAAWAGNRAEMEKLVRLGANINARVGRANETLLHGFANRGDTNMVEFLLSLGAQPVVAGPGTPLHVAAEKGRLNVIQVLL